MCTLCEYWKWETPVKKVETISKYLQNHMKNSSISVRIRGNLNVTNILRENSTISAGVSLSWHANRKNIHYWFYQQNEQWFNYFILFRFPRNVNFHHWLIECNGFWINWYMGTACGIFRIFILVHTLPDICVCHENLQSRATNRYLGFNRLTTLFDRMYHLLFGDNGTIGCIYYLHWGKVLY